MAEQGAPASWICAGVEASDTLHSALAEVGSREETTGVTTGAMLAATDYPAVVFADDVALLEHLAVVPEERRPGRWFYLP